MESNSDGSGDSGRGVEQEPVADPAVSGPDPPASRAGRRRKWSERLGPVTKGFAGAAAAVAIVTGVVGVLFELDPRLAPCLNTEGATLSAASPFPDTSYVQFATDHGLSDPQRFKTWGSGVEVRYLLHTDDLRGQTIDLYATVVRLARDGTVAAVVPGEDLRPALQDIPDAYCSQDEGSSILVEAPLRRGVRYRIILELYQGGGLNQRLAETETAAFDGGSQGH